MIISIRCCHTIEYMKFASDVRTQRPNITGYVGNSWDNAYGEASEAFSQTYNRRYNVGLQSINSIGGGILTLNASAFNAVYVINGKVYPLSLSLNFIIKI